MKKYVLSDQIKYNMKLQTSLTNADIIEIMHIGAEKKSKSREAAKTIKQRI